MKNKFWIFFLLVIVFSSFWACSQKDPIGIKQVLIDDPDSHAPVLTNVQLIGDSLKVEWMDNTPLDSQFKIYRKIEDDAFTVITTIDSIYFEYYDTYAFEDSTLITYYVETIAPTYTQQSNQIEYLYGSIPSGTQITINVTVDNDPDEASWNIYNYSTSSYYFLNDQTFSFNNENQILTIDLENGHFAVRCWDTAGDGGIEGTVTDDESNILVEWEDNDYNNYGEFHFWVN
ncbi:MAG: hypothetical protein KAS53_07685 [Candidatus Cloacimonetes bacterium]|nr:hypothetical protein [Candidatus Cloacimonadota bacterium]